MQISSEYIKSVLCPTRTQCNDKQLPILCQDYNFVLLIHAVAIHQFCRIRLSCDNQESPRLSRLLLCLDNSCSTHICIYFVQNDFDGCHLISNYKLSQKNVLFLTLFNLHHVRGKYQDKASLQYSWCIQCELTLR